MRVQRVAKFFGQVQGVGFRFTACRLAKDFDVTGYVMNLPDGSVELVAQGAEDELDRFISDIRAEMGSHIRRVDTRQGSASEPFQDFRIRY